MATRPKYSRLAVIALAGATALAGCESLQPPQERVYTVYVDLHAKSSPAGQATARPPVPEMLNPDSTAPSVAEVTPTETTPSPAETATATVTPTPVPTAVPAPKPKLVAKATKSVQEVKTLQTQTLEEMQRRGLLIEDLRDGKSRLSAIDKLQKRHDYDTALALLRSLQSDVRSLQIDEAFITQKNARLLTLIQEAKPSAELQAQIDRESEAINQLLEQADYDAINRKMNQLFNLLNP